MLGLDAENGLLIGTRRRDAATDAIISLEYFTFDAIDDPTTWATLDSWRRGEDFLSRDGEGLAESTLELQKLANANDSAIAGYNARTGLAIEAHALTLPARTIQRATGPQYIGINEQTPVHTVNFYSSGGPLRIATNKLFGCLLYTSPSPRDS